MTRSRAALLIVCAAAAAACGARSTPVKSGRVVVEKPALPPADPEAVRELEAALRVLRAGGPDANQRAEARLREAVRRDERLWEAWHDLGALLFARGDDAGAADAFGRALAINPAHSPALLARAEAYRRAGDIDRARADYQEVLRRAPENGQARARAASLLRQAGQYDAALDLLRDALRLAGGSSPIYLELGLVYLAQGRHELAELVLSKAAALDQKNPAILNALALVSMERHRDQEAFERFDRASALDPDFVDARYNVASVLIDAGDYGRAAAELQAVVDRRPADLGAKVALGVAHRGLGDHKKARALWDDVVKAAPPRSGVRADALFNLATLEMDFVMDEKSSTAALDRFLQESSANHPKRKEAEERRKEMGQ
ncbi:MAG TPA: tetratricopeptide repeat protein [Kofleriaceae bacterium]|nr:tetratricopeptide repeat protein [Kofleriaceae bacterium]